MKEKVGYVRIFGIPEVDNINKGKVLKYTNKLFLDSGERLDEYFSLYKDNKDKILITRTTVASMCLYDSTIDSLRESVVKPYDNLNKETGLNTYDLWESSMRFMIQTEIASIIDMLDSIGIYDKEKNNIQYK